MPPASSGGSAVHGIALSIVVIARNEEANIARCIESILHGIDDLHPEIILVDSASTDKTVEIASRYPITILQINSGAGLSPSAGRYVGARHAKGDFILFLDADMALIDGWLAAAMEMMTDSSIAAVGGRLYRVFPGEEFTLNHPDTHPLGQVVSLSGAALYRADALAASGGFNPYVKGEEERELGHRMVAKEYTMLRIEVPMVYHMDKHRTASEVDEKTGYSQGIGQVLRAYTGSKVAETVLQRNSQAILSALIFVGTISVALLLFLFSGNVVRVALLMVGVAAILWLRIKGQLWKLPLFARSRVLLLFHIFLGWLRGIPDPSTYQVSISLVRHQANSSQNWTG